VLMPRRRSPLGRSAAAHYTLPTVRGGGGGETSIIEQLGSAKGTDRSTQTRKARPQSANDAPG
jgi:hypothetical protein